jgi:antitoxin (DNA-binding transcriptional repressor) of toxin-antitoxin stability system
MERISVRDLHLRTSQIIRQVEQGGVFVIEKDGLPIAELRPLQSLPRTRRLPDREALIAELPLGRDSGGILEEDRS